MRRTLLPLLFLVCCFDEADRDVVGGTTEIEVVSSESTDSSSSDGSSSEGDSSSSEGVETGTLPDACPSWCLGDGRYAEPCSKFNGIFVCRCTSDAGCSIEDGWFCTATDEMPFGQCSGLGDQVDPGPRYDVFCPESCKAPGCYCE